MPPEIIVMVIATEVGMYRKTGFTGPDTFRWEPNITDYSAGPMQILSETARGTVQRGQLGYAADMFPRLGSRPDPSPTDLALYDAAVAIDVGTSLLRTLMDEYGPDPVLLAAAYNAGSLRESDENHWHVLTYGNHLDRAAEWYGDACDVIGLVRA